MLGCAIPGSKVIISEAQNPKRKLKYTLEIIHVGETWVGVNPLRANAIVEEAIRNGRIEKLHDFKILRREVPYGRNSRADFVLEAERSKTYVEVKSVSLAENGIAMFPDAPTERGKKHLRELISVIERGERAIMFFLAQRQDTWLFKPAMHIDPDYAALLKKAASVGVEILVYDCEVSENGVWIGKKLKWKLS
jgi:sugar fermentation stimulation protein A